MVEIIFYFTGTGNSMYAAKFLECEAKSIPRLMNSELPVYEAERIGVVCPIYGHEMPAMVKEFLSKARFKTDYLYLVLTYGSRHANAVELAMNVMHNAGKQADYITTLEMVDNFLPVFDMNEQISIEKRVDENLANIKADIIAKKKKVQVVTSQDREIHQEYIRLVNGAPETVWAKFLVTEECIGCGICAKVCPVGCIKLVNLKAVNSGINCQACYACIHACAEKAIKLEIPEKNVNARYRNINIALSEIVESNNQTDN